MRRAWTIFTLTQLSWLHNHQHTHTHTHTRARACMHVFTVWTLPRQCETVNLDMWPSASNDQSNASSNSILCTSTRTVTNSKHPNSQNVAIHKMYTTCKGSWCIVPIEIGRKRVSELTPLINSWLSQSVHLRARRFLCVFLVQRTHWFQPRARKKKKKEFKENACLWTSSRGQVLSSTITEKETDCSTQTTVLWRLMEKVNLFVSKLFLAVHPSSKWITVPPVSVAWSCTFIGALEQLRDSSRWIQGHVSEEKSPKQFFCVSVW